MDYTLSLTNSLEKGLDIYRQKNGFDSNQKALEAIVNANLETIVKEEYKKLENNKSIDDMANAL